MNTLSKADINTLISYRHTLHAHPELSLEEVWTAGFIRDRLEALGIAVHEKIGGNGLVGVIEGAAPGPAVALRADMDALAISETTGLSYTSKNPGKMHACGHDGHVAILIGTATLLARARDFAGTVYLVFQPAEERFGGARLMIEDGLLERFPFERIFGLHNWPDMPAGEVLLHDGPVMAGTSEFDITFRAEGAHAAMPHLSGDPLLAGGHFLTGLQQAVARAVDPYEAAVATVGSFHGGHTQNIIPQSADLKGTLRAFRMETLTLLRERTRAIAASAAATASCAVDLTFDDPMCPPVANTPAERDLMRAVVHEAGLAAYRGDPRPTMAGDDFGFFLLHRPGAYAWIGNGPAVFDGRLHQPAYDFNDAIIAPGATLLAGTAIAALADISN
ncbi:amidohydrolase [Shinella sp. 838]|jgi:amidohydrolase|uniref:amidohydrolase n=1 Tax=unclassified Shinella TaxID=2643062 RepID=UPI0003C53BA9|nr:MULTISPECIES: amidohydrolase [unclassified Shinella]EYR83907.1 hippurate hydrolase HipO [Shinella sp. DD12]MDG4675018.1 amidohydrolase [Shinella sp. 838]